MAWFDIADGRLRFRGRITKQPVTDWVGSEEGAAAVQAAAQQIRFSLIGRVRSARRRMHRELSEGIATRSVREAIAAESDRYLAAWTELAYAPSLPRATIALHRLVVVPRTLILARSLSGITARLAASPGIASLADPFKVFFARWILCEMDDAIRRSAPTPQRPVYAHESWACVALDTDFTWIDPMWSGPEWRGHVMMFEMPAAGLQRRDRRELEAAIEQLKQTLPNLSRQQRDGTLRMATDGMSRLTIGRPRAAMTL
jgi:hypothetical protein